MDLFTVEEIQTFFERNNYNYINAEGMQMQWFKEKGVWTHFKQCDGDEGPLEVSIITEEDSLSEFITGFQLKTFNDIDQLNYTNSWMRYLNGEAEIIINPMELEADISFKIVKSKTIIFSLDMHFYDEVYKHLTMPEDFIGYIDDHENRLFNASQHRYKLMKK